MGPFRNCFISKTKWPLQDICYIDDGVTCALQRWVISSATSGSNAARRCTVASVSIAVLVGKRHSWSGFAPFALPAIASVARRQNDNPHLITAFVLHKHTRSVRRAAAIFGAGPGQP